MNIQLSPKVNQILRKWGIYKTLSSITILLESILLWIPGNSVHSIPFHATIWALINHLCGQPFFWALNFLDSFLWIIVTLPIPDAKRGPLHEQFRLMNGLQSWMIQPSILPGEWFNHCRSNLVGYIYVTIWTVDALDSWLGHLQDKTVLRSFTVEHKEEWMGLFHISCTCKPIFLALLQ